MPQPDSSLPLSGSASAPPSAIVPVPQPLPRAPEPTASPKAPEPDGSVVDLEEPAEAEPSGQAGAERPAEREDVTALVFSNEPPPLTRSEGPANISLGDFEIEAKPETALSSAQPQVATVPSTPPPAGAPGTFPSTRSTTSGSPLPLPPEPVSGAEPVGVLPTAPREAQAPATLPAAPLPPAAQPQGQTTGFQSATSPVLPKPEPMPTAPRATTTGAPVLQSQAIEGTTAAAVPKPQPWPLTGQSSTPAAIVERQPTTPGSALPEAGQQATAMLPRALSSGSGAPGAASQPAALPPVTQSDGELSVPFAEGSADVADSYKPALQQLAFQLVADPAMRIRLVAYAGDGDGGEGRARRLSLSRALAIRSYLMRQGVQSTRMDVRALGASATSGPVDRVDIIPAS
jgi:outer membrane protein OmpA-like peptidoglycan-associated protein